MGRVGRDLGSNGLVKGRIFKGTFESRLERREGDSQADMNEQKEYSWSLEKQV